MSPDWRIESPASPDAVVALATTKKKTRRPLVRPRLPQLSVAEGSHDERGHRRRAQGQSCESDIKVYRQTPIKSASRHWLPQRLLFICQLAERVFHFPFNSSRSFFPWFCLSPAPPPSMLTASFRPPSGGWYVRPPVQQRGRSRQVSAAAKARVASEQRRARLYDQQSLQCHPISVSDPSLPSPIHLLLPEKPDSSATLPSSSAATSSPPPRPPSHPVSIHMPNSSSLSSSPPVNHSFPPADDSVCSSEASTSLSTDSYDSPPSPPSSLEDQVHVAYAMDDIRLAKILLLKLKGIEVTSDADPRIDEVHDEDFDVCFIPSGPLTIESEDRRAMEDWQRRQKEWGAESQRKKRLKTCEKVWDDEKQRLQSERLAALRLREQQIAAAEAERRRAAQRQHRDQPARDGHQRLSRVSGSLSSSAAMTKAVNPPRLVWTNVLFWNRDEKGTHFSTSSCPRSSPQRRLGNLFGRPECSPSKQSLSPPEARAPRSRSKRSLPP